jgi:Transcriptional regulators
MNNKEYIPKIEALVFKSRRLAYRRFMPDIDSGISASTFQLARKLIEHYKNSNDPLTTSEIANRMHMSLSATTQMINPLVEKGFLSRQKSRTDRRVTYITLTLKGRVVVGRIAKHGNRDNILNELFDFLGPDDSREMIRIVERIDEFLDKSLERK